MTGIRYRYTHLQPLVINYSLRTAMLEWWVIWYDDLPQFVPETPIRATRPRVAGSIGVRARQRNALRTTAELFQARLMEEVNRVEEALLEIDSDYSTESSVIDLTVSTGNTPAVPPSSPA